MIELQFKFKIVYTLSSDSDAYKGLLAMFLGPMFLKILNQSHNGRY